MGIFLPLMKTGISTPLTCHGLLCIHNLYFLTRKNKNPYKQHTCMHVSLANTVLIVRKYCPLYLVIAWKVLSIVFLLLCWRSVGIVLGDAVEYCQQEKFTARCDQSNEIVLMESAQYGRMEIGRCVRQDLGYVGCTVDALPTLHARCSGQPGGCELSIMDPALRNLKPCPPDVTWHLKAAYTCVPGKYLFCLSLSTRATEWPKQ